MSLNAATLEILIAKGLSASDLLDVARAMESTKTKSKAALRQARYRERKEAENVTNDVTCDVTIPPNDIYSNPPPSETKVSSDVNGKRARKQIVDWPCPDGVKPEHWRDLLFNRKTKRLPNTQTALEGQMADLARVSAETGWPPGEVVRVSAAKGWGSINNPNEGRNPQNGRLQADRANTGKPRGGTVDGFTAALRQVRDGQSDGRSAGPDDAAPMCAAQAIGYQPH